MSFFIPKVGTKLESFTLDTFNFSEIYSAMEPIWQEYRKITNAIEFLMSETERISNEYLLVLLSIGWPPAMDLEIHQMIAVTKAYNASKSDKILSEIEKLLLHVYNSDKLLGISESWQEKSFLKKRYPILMEAISAHIDGKYCLSIPTILPQIEGLIAGNYLHKGKCYGPTLITYIKNILSTEYKLKNLNPVIEGFLTTIVYAKDFEWGTSITSKLSRHAILHGADTNYATPANSLKAILAFHYLQDSFRLVSTQKGESYHKVGCPRIYNSKMTGADLIFYNYNSFNELNSKKACKVCLKNSSI